MALRTIVTGEDEILHKKSRQVTVFDQRLHQLLDDMLETMEQANGVGLAAVQVGVLRRVVVIRLGEEEPVLELINPVITEASEDQQCRRGLRLPGEAGISRRSG